ncbi:LacI family DNA-binding transcriptional regulator [Martelella sp. HB161492]|uniref:LacI family DNA-binding transcriptional regulator n=1 Tax=Martelella sp. HB161492 TaxID=2720726 RepID=UPI0015911E41|nr:LacI family DNA-binding transcriptional regulator [Martelella sp. HB161492]
MAKVTLKDVAREAGVSLATVDRVLHGRGEASLETRDRVKRAIHTLGFGRLPKAVSRSPFGRKRVLFLIPTSENQFVHQIVHAVRQAQRELVEVDLQIHIKHLQFSNDVELKRALESFDPEAYDGIGLFAFDLPGVRDIIDRLCDRGVRVVTIVSDIPASKRAAFVGIDNMAAGRTAARLMGRFISGGSGEVAIITGNQHIRDHVEREMGFRQIMGASYRQLRLLPAIETQSIPARVRSEVISLLQDHPKLVGLYAVGGGAEGVVAGLREFNCPHRPVAIVHELEPATRSGLQDGLVDAAISQNLNDIARSAIRALCLPIEQVGAEATNRLQINVFIAENVP